MRSIHALSGALTLAVSLGAAAQTKWDMPTPYAATNFHTENVVQFAADRRLDGRSSWLAVAREKSARGTGAQ